MVISILGCGWYGKALAGSLIKTGVTVKGSATSEEKADLLSELGIVPYVIRFDAEGANFNPAFFECDILVISIPPKLRKDESASYLPKIMSIIQAIHEYAIIKVIYISSTGVYGDHNSIVNELSAPMPDSESGNILLEAEKLFQQQTAFHTTVVRFGGLVGPGRHPGRFFAGKTYIPNGLAPVNLIHLDDCVGITTTIIQKDTFGYLFNASSPAHPAKEEFYREATLKAGLPTPEFIHELKSWKVVKSVNLDTLLGYKFKITNWQEATYGEV